MAGERGMTLPADVGRDVKMRLDVAARLAFPDGSIGISSLRREAKKGRLTVWRVANKDMTTLAEIDRMIERCRVSQSPPAYGYDPLEADALPHGSSLTVDASIAQAAALMRAERLRDAYTTTSPPSTTRRHEHGAGRIRRQ